MSASKRVTLKEDPDYPQPEESWMEFRLTYEGPLLSSQRDPEREQRDPRAQHKHEIRMKFHRQLKRLWTLTPALQAGTPSGPGIITVDKIPRFDCDSVAARYAMFGFNFVPLVRFDLNLICGLDILFLRPDKPGKLWKGDIDNRIKTLLDALSVPLPNDCYHERKREECDQPIFCLLEKDELITKLAIETDQMLDFDKNKIDEVRLIVTVRLRPLDLHLGNMFMG